MFCKERTNQRRITQIQRRNIVIRSSKSKDLAEHNYQEGIYIVHACWCVQINRNSSINSCLSGDKYCINKYWTFYSDWWWPTENLHGARPLNNRILANSLKNIFDSLFHIPVSSRVQGGDLSHDILAKYHIEYEWYNSVFLLQF